MMHTEAIVHLGRPRIKNSRTSPLYFPSFDEGDDDDEATNSNLALIIHKQDPQYEEESLVESDAVDKEHSSTVPNLRRV